MGRFEEAKGKIKEALADITDNPDLEREGKAQADKGEAQRQADEARAAVRGHEHEAKDASQEERSAQRAQ